MPRPQLQTPSAIRSPYALISAQRVYMGQFLFRFNLAILEISAKQHQPKTSFVGILQKQTPVIGSTIAPPLLDKTRGGAREGETDLCCSSHAQTIDAAEGGPTLWWCDGVSPLIVCALLCVSEPALCLCKRVESRPLRSLLFIYIPSSAQRRQTQVLSACE